MPQRIPNVAITLHRGGKRIEVTPGKAFNFTKEEIADLNGLNPNALRLPVNENNPDLDGQDMTTNDQGSEQVEERTDANARKAAGKATKKSDPDADKAKAEKAGLKEEGSNDDGEL